MKLKRYIRFIYEFLCLPFTHNFYFLALLFLLVSTPDIIGYFCYGRVKFAFYLGLHAYVMSYVIVLFGGLFFGRSKQIYEWVFLVLAVLDFCINVAIHTTCKTGFGEDMVAIIMGTNVAEMTEFLSAYFSFKFILFLFVALIVVFILYRNKLTIELIGKKFSIILLFLCIIGSAYLIYKRTPHWSQIYIGKYLAFLSYKESPNLKEYYHNPQINQIKEKSPKIIAMIIGESFSRSHSSLYGYEKQTNPALQRFVNDSLLFVFQDVQSPSTTTINAFQSIMSTYKPEYNDNINWYECITLQEIVSLSGYETIWLSNQSPTGIYDNVITSYASLCDSVIFVGAKYDGARKKDYDGEILEELNNLRKCAFFEHHDRVFLFIHLMGSHPKFRDRFPVEFDIFSDKDYPHLKQTQRRLIADYDNSILYNDEVVSNIIEILKDEEIMLIYFSDHGLDLFQSSETYIGHAIHDNLTSVKYASEIPYVILLSEKFQENYPKETEEISSMTTRMFRSDSTLDFILDIIGVTVDCDSLRYN